MAAAYYDVQRADVLKQLQGTDDEKIQALVRLADLGPDGLLCLDLAGSVATLLRDPADDVRRQALETLGAGGEVGAAFAGEVAAQLTSADELQRSYAAAALGMMGRHVARYCGNIARCFQDPSPTVRAAAITAIGSIGAEGFVTYVAACLGDKHGEVVEASLKTLCLLEHREASKHSDEVARKLADPNREIRLAALQYFAQFEDRAPGYDEAICRLLMDTDPAVRHEVSTVFAALKDKHQLMINRASAILGHQESRFRAAAAVAIGSTKAYGKSKAANIARLLDDTTEDRSQLVNCKAGIEIRVPSSARIPACAAMHALALMDEKGFAPNVQKLLSEGHPSEVRAMAATTLAAFGGDFDVALAPLLGAREPQVRASAATALGKLQVGRTASQDVVDKLAELLVDASPVVRVAAAEALGSTGDEGSAYTEALLQLLADRSSSVRAAAVMALAGVGVKGQLYASDVARKMGEQAQESAEVKVACVRALAAMGARGAAFADEVSALGQDPDGRVRVAVLEALVAMGAAASEFAAPALEAARNDPLEQVRDRAEKLHVKVV
eukprot:TRINITY_DN65243_c0_g1_i1.p1 TRINITY_DN65243_c0_g1~~TRINITY_DN65243_c0_g1_i1.p1  ORF type:complete len:557 (+),score=112.20 TRINITY_DN65243_c0_g1_i1:50-1720(+)